jgi:PTS system nitrogen regulatory IIA component
MQEKDILTIKDVAERLQVSERTVSDWAQKGEIPCGKLGNSWRFKRIEVEHWLNKKLVGNKRESKTHAIAIADVLTKERVLFLEASAKKEVLNLMIDCLAQAPEIEDRDELAYEIFYREDLMSTGIGLGIAIPHVRLPSLNKTIMSAALIQSGLDDYNSLDGQPVQLVFMIASGHHQHAEYLKLLSSLANLVKEENARQQLINSISPEDFFKTLGQQH